MKLFNKVKESQNKTASETLKKGPSYFWTMVSLPPILAISCLEFIPQFTNYAIRDLPNIHSMVFFSVTVFTALMTGIFGGLLSAVLFIIYSLYHFSIPGQLLSYADPEVRRLAIFGIGLPLVALGAGYFKEHSEKIIAREQEARLKAQNTEKRYRDLVNSLDAIVWEADPQSFQFKFISKRVEKVLGYLAKQWLSEPHFWSQHIHNDDRDWVINYCKKHIDAGKDYHIDYRIITGDKRTVWVRDSVNLLKEKNKVVSLRGIMIDITERKKLEERKDEFIGVASHELKTPLTSIKAFTQILRRHFKNAKNLQASRYLMKMDNQLNKLTSLVYDLLDVSKIQSGKMELSKEFFDFDYALKEVIDDIQETTQKQYIIREGKSKKKVYADKYRIEQVITNLLSNAIKYSEGSDKIIVGVTSTDKQIKVSVQDFGMGVSKNHQTKIFDRFYTNSSNKSKSNQPGLGLGLYISHEIISRHDGKLWVESDGQSGSTFYFTLPIILKN